MTNQKGFAHAFLIIGLLVALVGALGFVFWQNFIYKEPVITKTETVVVTKPSDENESDTNKNFTVLTDWNARFPSGSYNYELKKGSDSVSEYYHVTTEEIKKACGGNEAIIGSIIRYEADTKMSEGMYEGMTPREAFADATSKVVTSKYIYIFAGPQSACSEDDQANKVLTDNIALLNTQFKKLEEF
ncbi:MAG TPA: hypothetical protein PK096_00035 [Candidatus Saccharibacteria bacterium]|nr:hypothetical protein [Patescibacteria group bacterium]HRJ05945.1 hypothetical protein [Candidatus Saccharibacteria bacterium]HRK93743.1 hypothetical protein [Candidatus Saccharibacteria bacterium]